MIDQININGITESDFQTWKHNPVTKLLRQFMTDFAGALERDHLLRWKAKTMDDKTEYEAVGRIQSLEELVSLEFGHIVAFYEEIEQKEQHETETIRNPLGEV